MTSLFRFRFLLAFSCCLALSPSLSVGAQEVEIRVDMTHPAFAKAGWTPWSCNCGGDNSCTDEGPDGIRLIDPNTLSCEQDDILNFCTGSCAFDDSDTHDPRTGIFFTADEAKVAVKVRALERDGSFNGLFTRGAAGASPGEYPDMEAIQARGDDSLARDLYTVTSGSPQATTQGALRMEFRVIPAGT